MPMDPSTPVLLLGGQENTISVAESLARNGIDVAVTGDAHCWGLYSKHAGATYRVPEGESPHDFWNRLLLSPGDSDLDGRVILAMNDTAIEFVLNNHDALKQRHIVEEYIPGLRTAMLDKLRTLELANEVGVPAPRFWRVGTRDDVLAIRDEIVFPVMVKPLHSHRFVEVFGRKLFIVENDFADVLDKTEIALANDMEVMIVEMIPGGDDLLSSFYTYMDENGAHLVQYTKRIWRRFPKNRGGAVFHETEWLPETAAMGRRFFEGIGWRGLGNIEFKRDPRDGVLKIIEVNSRITAAHRLLAASGVPIDLIAYCRLTNQPPPRYETYREGLFFWYPLRDFRAFLELRRDNELTLAGWLKSLWRRPIVLAMPLLGDPRPFLAQVRHLVRANLRKLFARNRGG